MLEQKVNNKIDKSADHLMEMDSFLDKHHDIIIELGDVVVSQKEVVDKWLKDYSHQPESFFSEDNFNKLRSLNSKTRLAMLYGASCSLQVSLDRFAEYYKAFPEDLALLEANCYYKEGNPSTISEYYLWSISQSFMKGCRATWYKDKDWSCPVGDFANIEGVALRRAYSSDAMLSDYSDLEVDDFSAYGDAAQGMKELVEDVRVPDYKKESFVKPQKIFTQEFLNLSDTDQSTMLRQGLACMHSDRIFKEVFNSNFLPNMKLYNGVHSALFKTKQKNSFYKNEGVFLYSINNQDDDSFAEEHGTERSILVIIKALADCGHDDKEKNIDFLLEFWDKNRNPLFSGEIARALSSLDSDLAANKLLKMLKDEKGDKNFLSAMLYRLEFGKLQISNEGAKYLEKIYDLGEYNNPDYYINRLTVDGDIGIFDEELALIKYFQLGELDSEDKKIKAKILDFTYETLFIGSNEETQEEKTQREKYLQEFKDNYFSLSNDELFKESEVALNNLSFKEQGWFLIAFNQADDKKKDKIRSLVAQHQEDGVKSFLALEIDNSLGDKLININENITEKEDSRLLFYKLARISELAFSTTDELKDYFIANGDPKNIQWQDIRLALLGNVKKIINNFNNTEYSSEEMKKLLKELDAAQVEITFLSTLLRNVKENEYDLDWNLIKDLSLNIKNFGLDMDAADKKDVLAMAKTNWSEFGNEKMADTVMSGLEIALDNTKNQRCYILKYKGKLIAFVRFEKTEQGTLYAGSLNVSKDLRGLNIGNEMMQQALVAESEHNILEASASVKIPAGCAYIEKVGFVADGIIENYHGSNEDLFNISLDKNKNPNYRFRNEGKQKPINQEDIKVLAINTADIDKYIGDPVIVLSFDWEKDIDLYQDALRKLLIKKDERGHNLEEKENKYVVTRYFQDKAQKGDVRYLVLEKQ